MSEEDESGRRADPAGPTAEAASAPDRLLAAAERNFALYGVEGVPISRIVREAGQRNVSAISYYFGDRRSLVRAILSSRLGELNARRQAMLDEMRGSGRPLSVRDCIVLLVLPLANFISSDTRESYYVRFLLQVHVHLDYRPMREEHYHLATSFLETLEELRRHLACLDPRLVDGRIGDLSDHILASLAFIEALIGRRSLFDVELRVHNLIDGLTAAIHAEISAETGKLLVSRA